MELVLMGVLVGWLVGMVVGWIGGRMTGISEGRYRERCCRSGQDVGAAEVPSRRPGVDPALLAQDSMAEFTTAGDRVGGARGRA